MDKAQTRYWFAAKRYGWGWGWPIAWQGWGVLFIYGAALIAIAWLAPPPVAPLAFAGGVSIASLLLVLVCWRTGEAPHWRWGGR